MCMLFTQSLSCLLLVLSLCTSCYQYHLRCRQFIICATVSATVSADRFMAPHCLPQLLYCFDLLLSSLLMYILLSPQETVLAQFLSSHLSQDQSIQFPVFSARSYSHDSLLCLIFSVYSFRLHVHTYQLFWHAGLAVFSPSITYFTIVCVQFHWFCTAT